MLLQKFLKMNGSSTCIHIDMNKYNGIFSFVVNISYDIAVRVLEIKSYILYPVAWNIALIRFELFTAK